MEIYKKLTIVIKQRVKVYRGMTRNIRVPPLYDCSDDFCRAQVRLRFSVDRINTF